MGRSDRYSNDDRAAPAPAPASASRYEAYLRDPSQEFTPARYQEAEWEMPVDPFGSSSSATGRYDPSLAADQSEVQQQQQEQQQEQQQQHQQQQQGGQPQYGDSEWEIPPGEGQDHPGQEWEQQETPGITANHHASIPPLRNSMPPRIEDTVLEDPDDEMALMKEIAKRSRAPSLPTPGAAPMRIAKPGAVSARARTTGTLAPAVGSSSVRSSGASSVVSRPNMPSVRSRSTGTRPSNSNPASYTLPMDADQMAKSRIRFFGNNSSNNSRGSFTPSQRDPHHLSSGELSQFSSHSSHQGSITGQRASVASAADGREPTLFEDVYDQWRLSNDLNAVDNPHHNELGPDDATKLRIAKAGKEAKNRGRRSRNTEEGSSDGMLDLEYDNQGRISNLDPAAALQVGAYADNDDKPLSKARLDSTTRTASMGGSGTIRTASMEGSSGALKSRTGASSSALDLGEDAECEPLEKKKPWWKQNKYILALVGLLLVGVAAAVIPIVMKPSGDSEREDQSITPEKPKEEGFDLSLVPNMMNSTILALEDPDSPQYLAYDWISKDDGWDTYEDWRKRQRFAVACVYYSFTRGGNQGWGTRLFLHEISYQQHECDWFTQYRACPVTGDDDVIEWFGLSFDSGQRGSLPPEIAYLPNLVKIDFTHGSFNPSLEDFLPLETPHSLASLELFRFLDGGLKGTIPSTLGLLTSLTLLDLRENFLTSTIPSELGLLTDLTTLVLSSNKLSGTVPEEVLNLPLLTTIDLEDNPEFEAP